jgi:hypothetical protein
MTYLVKHVNGSELFKSQYSTIKEAVQEAVKTSANLRGANLRRANLYSADLYSADLRGANLYSADLWGANLRGANLRGANLRRANLYSADLSGANLRGANLRGANLSGADLYSADLYSADLSGADLYSADLRGADLSGANLSDTKNADLVIARTRILPEGDLVGWKKCINGVIVKLWIPYAAKRSHAFGRKCRAEYAQVIEVFGAEVGISQHDHKTEYRAGMMIKPDGFDENWQKECANGVHFYISRIEAENH